MVNSGSSISAGIEGAPHLVTLAGWCSVLHQFTDHLIIGRLMAPTTANSAADWLDLLPSSKLERSNIYPKYKNNSTNTDVNRASHTQ